ncbi:MAG: CRISPR-associated protein Csx11, partial [Candidatus Methanosuratincola sp.]
MSNDQRVEELENCRAAITFVELACLLHDLGKCASGFIQSMLKHPTIEKYNHMHVLKSDKELIEKIGLKEFFEGYLAPVFLGSSAGRIVKEWSLDQISIKDFIEKHERTEPETKLIAFIQIADRKDAADDRTMPLAKQEKETNISSVFGKETKIEEDLDNARKSFYEELSIIWKGYETHLDAQKLRKEVYDAFGKLKNALAETRRAANDVSLVDHSYATASIMKALLCWDVLEDFSITLQNLLPTHRHWKTKLRVLGIGWNTNRLFAEAQSLSGIAGRERLVDRVKRSLEDFLEYDIPIGNVIYEDQNSIYFLVPENTPTIFDNLKEQIIKRVDALTDGSLIPIVKLSDPNPYPNKVITKTIERIKEGTTTSIQENLIPNWVRRWDKVSYAEVCIQCGKRPRTKDEDFCEFCFEMMKDGISDVLKSTVVPSVYKETVWTDEIADECGNVALIYGLFPLEKWLDGTLLKTMRIKTIQDIKNWNQAELMKTLKDETKVQGFFEDYSGLIRAVQKFEESLKNNDVEDAAKVLHPFLEPNFRPQKKELLQDTYTGLYSRAEPQTPAGVLEVIMTKSPSPSRIRKIWVETRNFFEDLSAVSQSSVLSEIGDYCLRLKFKPRFSNEEDERRLKFMKYRIIEVEKMGFETELPKSDLFWDGEFMYTTIRLEHYVLGDGLEERQKRIKSLIEDVTSSGKTFAVLKIKDRKISISIESYDFEKYIPTRTILVSPYLFVVIVPGNLAVDLLYKKYFTKYEGFFCKVSDRLPFNTGILFFKRKFPLYVALDVMERFTEYLLKLS